MNELRPKKSLGQNFLIDHNIIRKIVSIGKINHESIIFEIGPGTGNLTKEILKKKPKKTYVIEKDNKLLETLKKDLKSNKKIFFINDDILKFNENKFFKKNIIVYGNLPYNISTQILAKWILLKKWPPWYNSLILMFQKEVADRILAKRNSKNYGRLSILCNWRMEIKKHFDISKNCFFPKPKVDSTILSFAPKLNTKYMLKNPKILEYVSRILFSHRRKMINKSFFKLFKKNDLIEKKLNLDLSLRAENLENETFYKLAQLYEKTS